MWKPLNYLSNIKQGMEIFHSQDATTGTIYKVSDIAGNKVLLRPLVQITHGQELNLPSSNFDMLNFELDKNLLPYLYRKN